MGIFLKGCEVFSYCANVVEPETHGGDSPSPPWYVNCQMLDKE